MKIQYVLYLVPEAEARFFLPLSAWSRQNIKMQLNKIKCNTFLLISNKDFT